MIAFIVTFSIFIFEVIGAVVTRSLALLVDSAHMLTDVGGLLLALFVAGLAKKPANSRRTWGYGRAEVLSATLQAGILFCVGIFVFIEGLRRLFIPPDIPSGKLLFFGTVGLVGNIISIFVLAGARNSNFNLRAAYLEVINDALGSLAVIVAAVIIATTGWMRAHAVGAILIGGLILPRTFKLLRETVEVLMESTPRGLDIESVRSHILELPHVQSVHDLHATYFATGLPVLTAHVVVDKSCFFDGHTPQMLDELQKCVAEHFEIQIQHSTFQLESPEHAKHEHATHK
ncbi:MAG: cation diffusion facilitator family transporter [bacterium]|nr:cation diffusion facilitator family transporter [bacterium]